MLTETLAKLFDRDLKKLKAEILLYKKEANLWKTDKEVTNCAGNLCLHLVGNLNTFIGANLGGTGYIRQRDKEFSLKDVPREELIRQIEEVMEIVVVTLKALTPETLEAEYTHRVFPEKMTTAYFLTHLLAHLSYHLGQINYHRRLLDA